MTSLNHSPVLMTFLILFWSGFATARQNCADNLRQAQTDYEMGRLELVNQLLEPCLTTELTEEQLRDAYVLLIKSWIGLDDYDRAREKTLELIRLFPDFAPDTNDPPIFKNWIDAIDENPDLDTLYFQMAQRKVVTASQVEETTVEAPATIHVVSEEQIRDRGYRHLKDLLEDIPEVEIQTKSVAQFSNYYTFRGVSGNEKFIILLDGFRFNSPTGTPHVIEYNYPLVNVIRVEVILGPASALYGADAFGGIVNMITRSGDAMDGGEAVLSGGEYGARSTSVAYGKEIGRFNFSLSGNYHQSDEADYTELYPEEYQWWLQRYIPNGEMRTDVFNPDSVIVLPEEKQNLPFEAPVKATFLQASLKSGNFEVGFAQNSEKHASSVAGRPEFYLFTDKAFFHTMVSSIYGRHVAQGKNWTLKSSLWGGSYETRPDSNYTDVFTAYESGYKYSDNRTFKIDEQLLVRLSSSKTFIGGVSFERVSALPETGDLPTPFDKDKPADSIDQGLYYLGTNVIANPGTENEEDLTRYQRFYSLSYRNWATYAQFQHQGRRWHLTLGGRYDESSRYGGTFNPRAGLVVSPKERMHVKLLYGEAFLAPSPWVTYQHFGNFQPADVEGRFVPVGPDGNPLTDQVIDRLRAPFWHLPPENELKPEKLKSWEAAFSWYFHDNLSVYVDYYQTRVEDRIENVNYVRDQSQSGGGVFHDPYLEFLGVPVDFAAIPNNVGTLESNGGTIRFEGLFQLKSVKASARLAWTFSDGELNGRQLPYSAENTVKAGVELKYRSLVLHSRLLSRSASYQEGGEGNSSFSLVNLFARYKLFTRAKRYNISGFLRVENLFDEEYRNVSFGGPESFIATPQDPRRISGGATFSF